MEPSILLICQTLTSTTTKKFIIEYIIMTFSTTKLRCLQKINLLYFAHTPTDFDFLWNKNDNFQITFVISKFLR